MILHTINKSPFLSGAMKTCQQFLGKGDAIVLLEDGVYGALRSVPLHADESVKVYAIAADIGARGIGGSLREDVIMIDYGRFVTLCTEFTLIRSWS